MHSGKQILFIRNLCSSVDELTKFYNQFDDFNFDRVLAQCQSEEVTDQSEPLYINK